MIRIVRRNSFVTILCIAWLSLTAGCGKSQAPKTVPVAGVVLYLDKPVAGAYVMFTGKGPLAHGETDAQGHFSLMTTVPGDGAPPGDYKVTVSKSAPDPADKASDPTLVEWKNLLPERYSDVTLSSLVAKVEEGKKNEFKFELTD
jgi:hypothetical protein